MDERRFDSLARLLGQAANRREGLRAALGGLLGVGAGAQALDALANAKGSGNRGRDARADDGADDDDVDDEKHRKICSKRKPCPSGWSCVKGKKKKHGHKRRRQRTCVCQSGITCGAACCASGQTCQDGACADAPEPVVCIAKGEACKGIGRPCCDGMRCGSGQGGDDDIACYVNKRGACTATSDCIFGTTCQNGMCMGPVQLTEACQVGDICIQGACLPYNDGNPAGTFCLKGFGDSCTADNQCVGHYCEGGICRTAVPTSYPCGASNGGAICQDRQYDECIGYLSGTPSGSFCLREAGEPCGQNMDCRTQSCSDGICRENAIPTGDPCVNGDRCIDSAATCREFQAGSGGESGTYCLLPDNLDPGATPSNCTGNGQCSSNRCAKLSSTGTDGSCAPLTCTVCIPYDDTSACPYNSIQEAVDGLATAGSSTQIDVQVYTGTYEENVWFPDDSWYLHPCATRPLITADSGTLIGLDVNSAPSKYITIEEFDLAGETDEAFLIWGCKPDECPDQGGPSWLNFTMSKVTTDFTGTKNAQMNLYSFGKVTIVDSTVKGMNVYTDDGGDAKTEPLSEFTLFRSTMQPGANAGKKSAIDVQSSGAKVTLSNATISGWDSDDLAGAISWWGNENLGSILTLLGTTKITGNTADFSGDSSNDGSGIGINACKVKVKMSNGTTVWDYATGNPTGTLPNTNANKRKNCAYWENNAWNTCPDTEDEWSSSQIC